MILKGRMSQCPLCDLIFASDNACERHKPYATPKTETCKDPSSIGMILRDRGWVVPVPEGSKWWSNTTKAEPAGPQTLTCIKCGIVWKRAAVRGRKPRLCDSCK